MNEAHKLFDLINSGFSVLWILVYFALAAISFFRFRLTPSGWLMGGAFLALGLKLVLVKLIFFGLRHGGGGYEAMQLVHYASMLLSFLLCLVIAAGIALIPKSLSMLSRKT